MFASIFVCRAMWFPGATIFVSWPVVIYTVVTVLSTWTLSASASSQQPAESIPLTLQAALRLAEARSQALVAFDEMAKSAQEMVVVAGRLPDPVLNMSLDNIPVEGATRFSLTDDASTRYSAGLTQTFLRKPKRQAHSARFERDSDTALAMRKKELSVLRTQTALAWFDRFYKEHIVELLMRQRHEATLQIEAANASYRSRQSGQPGVFVAESAVARLDDRIEAARARVIEAGISLARWIGDDVASTPLGSAPYIDRTWLTRQTLLQQLDQHPELVVLTNRIEIAKSEVEIARQNKRADWSASFRYRHRAGLADAISVAVSRPLQWNQTQRQDRELAASLAKLEQTRAERAEKSREILAQTERLFITWHSYLSRLVKYDQTIIPIARQQIQSTLASYRGGSASLAAVLDARLGELEVRLERLRLEAETAAVWTSLEYLIPHLVKPIASARESF